MHHNHRMLRTRWLVGTALLSVATLSPMIRAYRAIDPALRHPMLPVGVSVRGPRTLALLRRLSGTPSEVVDGVEVTAMTVPAGHIDVPVVVYRPTGHRGPSGALLWLHGGGLVSGATASANAFCSETAAALGIVVVGVDYRLAPEHPFPAPLDDCTAAFRWLVTHAGEFGVAPDRVAVGGSSAGAGLAASLCQRLRDEAGPRPCFQLLRYPMIDDRTARGRGLRRHVVWSARSNRFGWTSYLGRPPRAADAPPYAAAARTEDLTGLPPAWIGVGDADLFYEEDRTYADRLATAGVAVELHVVPGMYHGADGAAADIASMRDFRCRERAALAAALADR